MTPSFTSFLINVKNDFKTTCYIYVIRMLSSSEKQRLLQEVPFVKLSYENIGHKKVDAFDYISIIPRGGKCFLWFYNATTCYLVKLEKRQKVDIFKVPISFPPEYTGSLLYGTFFHHEGKKIISIENSWMVDQQTQMQTWGDKLVQLRQLLASIQCAPGYIIGVPVMCKTMEEATRMSSALPYKIYAFHYFSYAKINWYEKRMPTTDGMQQIHPSLQKQGTRAIFQVTPDRQSDIYHLFCIDDETGEKKEHSIAHICNYQSSVFMNSLFRNIKENRNLDALEESDDEEEFENIEEDKYVQLDTSHKMICEYHAKFKKWTPVQVAPEDATVVTWRELQ